MKVLFGRLAQAVLPLLGGWQLLSVVVVLATVLASTAYLRGRADGAGNCKAAFLAAENLKLRKELAFYRWLSQTAAMRATNDARELSALRKQVEDFTDALETDQHPGCALSADDARRLRDIR